MYQKQESLLFNPRAYDQAHALAVKTPNLTVEEFTIKTADGAILNGIFFDEVQSEKLIFYCHGNSGNIYEMQNTAAFYTNLGYDFIMVDYRSYGKSTGSMINEAQFFDDMRLAFKECVKKYQPENITILGYSIGTCVASLLTSENKVEQLILLAPYYSMLDLALKEYPYLPSALLKYPFETYKYVEKIKVPITIFHGVDDSLIPVANSKRLKRVLKENDQVVLLNDTNHNNIYENPYFVDQIKKILN